MQRSRDTGAGCRADRHAYIGECGDEVQAIQVLSRLAKRQEGENRVRKDVVMQEKGGAYDYEYEGKWKCVQGERLM